MRDEKPQPKLCRRPNHDLVIERACDSTASRISSLWNCWWLARRCSHGRWSPANLAGEYVIRQDAEAQLVRLGRS